MVTKILDLMLSESPRNALSKIFCSPRLSIEYQILHCLRKNFPVELPQHSFHGLKITTGIDSQTRSWRFYHKYQNNKCFCWHGPTAHDEDGGQEQRTHLILLPAAKIFTLSL